MSRTHITVAIQKRPNGLYQAIVADHGTELPGSDGANISVAKIEQPSAEELAVLVSAAVLGAIRKQETEDALDSPSPYDSRN